MPLLWLQLEIAGRPYKIFLDLDTYSLTSVTMFIINTVTAVIFVQK